MVTMDKVGHFCLVCRLWKTSRRERTRCQSNRFWIFDLARLSERPYWKLVQKNGLHCMWFGGQRGGTNSRILQRIEFMAVKADLSTKHVRLSLETEDKFREDLVEALQWTSSGPATGKSPRTWSIVVNGQLTQEGGQSSLLCCQC